jgi:hypothetical protein
MASTAAKGFALGIMGVGSCAYFQERLPVDKPWCRVQDVTYRQHTQVGMVDAAVGGWASCVSWALLPGSLPSKAGEANNPADQLCLAVGGSDGSCRLYGGAVILLSQQVR